MEKQGEEEGGREGEGSWGGLSHFLPTLFSPFHHPHQLPGKKAMSPPIFLALLRRDEWKGEFQEGKPRPKI